MRASSKPLLLCLTLLLVACGVSSPLPVASPSLTPVNSTGTTGSTGSGTSSGGSSTGSGTSTGGSSSTGASGNTSCPTTEGGISPSSVAVDPAGQFAYVAGSTNCLDGQISIYSIDPATGMLTAAGAAVNTGDEGAVSVAVAPSGKFVYTANWGEGDTAGSTSTFTVNPTTGMLTSAGLANSPCAAPPVPGSCGPWSLAVHPSGRFVYVANEGGFSPTSVSTYAAGTGALSLTQVVAADGRAVAVAVDPSGRFAYVAAGGEEGIDAYGVNKYDANISMYTIDPTTGALTSIGAIAAGTSPTAITVDPSGKFVYAANTESSNVSMYSINSATGALTSIGTVAAGTGPVSIAVNPSGKFAYVTNTNSLTISMYAIDGTTGALSLIGTLAI